MFNGIGLKCMNRPQMYSSLIGSEREFCTFEADLYIWGRVNLFSHVICLSQSETRICTFEANYRIGLKCTDRPQVYRIGLKCTALWLAQRENSVHFGPNRPQMYIHLRPICTFEAELIYFLMWSVWANQRPGSVHLRPITESASNVRIGLKCTGLASNVWATVAPLPGEGVRSAMKSARLARGSDALAW